MVPFMGAGGEQEPAPCHVACERIACCNATRAASVG